MTLTDFLLARIAEDERPCVCLERSGAACGGGWCRSDCRVCSGGDALTSDERVLAECEAKRRIVEWHKSWPVLAQTPPTFERVDSADPSSLAFRASQQMAWLTEQEYRDRFGSEPPTGPVLRLMATVYADHPDYREEWRS